MASNATPVLRAPTLSIVVPTYKESKNISVLFERITAALDGDLQHDESILLAMYQVLAKGAGDLAIGTRVRDASEGALSPARQRLSDPKRGSSGELQERLSAIR